MKALVIQQSGPIRESCVIQEIDRPAPGPGEVLVQVEASTFNYHDVFTVRGMPGITIGYPRVPGLDAAGRVIAAGEGVDPALVGTRCVVFPLHPTKGLMGEMLDGGMAEYLVAHADQVLPISEEMDAAEAASLGVAYGTAYRMLITKKTVNPGDRVLVLGAAGGVGVAAVQLCKDLGAEVIAAVGSEDKAEVMRAIGADAVVNYREHDFRKWVFEHYGKPSRRDPGTGLDVVVNSTGGDTWVDGLKCLRRGGRVAVCGATAGFDPKEDLRFVWTFELSIVGSTGFTRPEVEEVIRLTEAGRLRPLVSTRLRLDDAVEGLAMLEDRTAIGKVAILPGGATA
ncbi:zinc-binding dehydrogenase [Propioniciclava coleopterorum]|uniref:Zinc-binding dehydrogenase n=1 Tax=Propioniciclava coleopterorum TaxID=2714937 RepID=A0A6G7Y719_9ACTN|nr:zinc-binding dehydrogenase [Propioniciclava coleopterorum]QIK72612.1 zinc-binding dehydrogenase [Propioniciclava coleopterorum]